MCPTSAVGPITESITGKRMNPLAIPKVMIPNQARKKTTKMYDLEPLSMQMAKKVEKPPWKILDPI
jgi:hypothetical protein